MTRFAALRRQAMSRRAVLRGAGCTLALPWLDAMRVGLSSPRPGATPRRAVFVFQPNGMSMPDWIPKQEGTRYEMPFLLEPLAAHRKRVLVASGLALDGGRAKGDGPGDHARASASFLTGAHPRKTAGDDIENGVSVDQVAAQALGDATPFRSLELGMEPGRSAGRCDSGYSCAYTRNISWSSPTTPVAKETDPRELFRRLFGDPEALHDAERTRALRAQRRSLLDAVRADAKALSRDLGPEDRGKLDEYLTSVRSVEERLARAEASEAEFEDGDSGARIELPDALRPEAGGLAFVERLQLMYELITLALTTDSTRIVTFMLGNAGSNRTYRWIGAPGGHHNLSHHRGDAHKVEQIRKINRFHCEQFALFCDRLAAHALEDGDLLGHTMVLFGSGLADGNRHRHEDLPILIAGGDQMKRPLPTGRHVRQAKETPLANLYLSMLERLGVKADTFADSTRKLF